MTECKRWHYEQYLAILFILIIVAGLIGIFLTIHQSITDDKRCGNICSEQNKTFYSLVYENGSMKNPICKCGGAITTYPMQRGTQ